MHDDVASSVRFLRDNQQAAVEYLVATAEAADPSRTRGTWVSITPVDPPEEALPEKKNWRGKVKRGLPPAFDIIYLEGGDGSATHMGTLSSDGPDVTPTLQRHGVTIPADWKIDDSGTSLLLEIPVATSADQIVEFSVAALTALLEGADVQFDATLQG